MYVNNAGREAEEMMLAAVRVGPWPVGALRELLGAVGASEWHIAQAASSLARRGELVVLTRKFWAHSSFLNQKRDLLLYAEDHSRAELISRLSTATNTRSYAKSRTAIEALMQGDDAERLAQEDFGRNG